MMQYALANAFLTGALISSPVAASYDAPGDGNVIRVNYQSVAHAACEPTSARDANEPIGNIAHISMNEVTDWKAVATSRLSALHRLRPGWDGQGSIQPSDDILSRASRILDIVFSDVAHHAAPAAVPCADGSLQLEWWLVDTRFELAIEPNGAIEGWALDRMTGREVSAEDAAAIELLAKWASRLTADKLVLQA